MGTQLFSKQYATAGRRRWNGAMNLRGLHPAGMLPAVSIIFSMALSGVLMSASLPALATSCNASCPTCHAAQNHFERQTREALLVGQPPTAQNAINAGGCLGSLNGFNISNMFSSGLSISALIQQMEQTIMNTACAALSGVIGGEVGQGNSLMQYGNLTNIEQQVTSQVGNSVGSGVSNGIYNVASPVTNATNVVSNNMGSGINNTLYNAGGSGGSVFNPF
jgi:hypothetical protein